jgi:DNA-binding MarR family transcriptional regulator
MAVARKKARAADAEAAEGAEVDFGRLDTFVGFHLRMAQTASFQAFAREAGEIDLSPGRYAILSLIGDNPGISQTALSRANARDKSSLTPALDDLERRGLIVRERVATDRRSYALSLTPAGERTRRRLDECAERHERNMDRIIGLRERAKFIKILRKLTAELGDQGE